MNPQFELLMLTIQSGNRNHAELHILDCTTFEWSISVCVTGTRPLGRNGHTATLVNYHGCRRLVILGGWLGSGPLAASDLHLLYVSQPQDQQPQTARIGWCHHKFAIVFRPSSFLFLFRMLDFFLRLKFDKGDFHERLMNCGGSSQRRAAMPPGPATCILLTGSPQGSRFKY